MPNEKIIEKAATADKKPLTEAPKEPVKEAATEPIKATAKEVEKAKAPVTEPKAEASKPSPKESVQDKSEKPESAAKAPEPPTGAAAIGPTGTAITKLLDSRLTPPDEKERKALPKPKEGEAFSVLLHPAYLKKAEFNTFSVDRDSDDFKELYKSIELFGVKDPVLARPGKDGLEILSGQRRHLIASELNYPVPTIIQRMDDDDARILVADGNLHREKISTYDQSRALRMKVDSMKHKAGRRKKGEAVGTRTDEAVAAEMGVSIAKLHRLLRLSTASREVCALLDDGQLTLSVASVVGQLKPEHQTMLTDLVSINLKPSAEQVERMRKVERSGRLTEDAMRDIIDDKDIAPKPQFVPSVEIVHHAPLSTPTPVPTPAPTPVSITPSIPKSSPTPSVTISTPASAPASEPPKPVTPSIPATVEAPKPAEPDPFVGKQERAEETRIVLRGDRLRKYFPNVEMTPREIEDSIYDALEERRQRQERQRQKAEIFKPGKAAPTR